MEDKTLIIKRLKEAYNLRSNVKLAKFLGVSAQVLSNWQNRNTVNYDTIFSKCEDLNLDWLISGEGEVFKHNLKKSTLTMASEDGVPYEKTEFGKGRRCKSKDSDQLHIENTELKNENISLNNDLQEMKKHNDNLRKAVNALRKELGKKPVDFIRDKDWEKPKTKKR